MVSGHRIGARCPIHVKMREDCKFDPRVRVIGLWIRGDISARNNADDQPRAVWRFLKSAADGRHHAFAATGEKVYALGCKPAAKAFSLRQMLFFAGPHDPNDRKAHAHLSASFGVCPPRYGWHSLRLALDP